MLYAEKDCTAIFVMYKIYRLLSSYYV